RHRERVFRSRPRPACGKRGLLARRAAAARHRARQRGHGDLRQPDRGPALRAARPPHRHRAGAGAMKAVRRVLSTPEGLIGSFLLALLVGAALLAPMLFPGDPLALAGRPMLRPFVNPDFPLGTDRLGRDVLAGVLHGTRTSLAVGLAAALAALVVGVV